MYLILFSEIPKVLQLPQTQDFGETFTYAPWPCLAQISNWATSSSSSPSFMFTGNLGALAWRATQQLLKCPCSGRGQRARTVGLPGRHWFCSSDRASVFSFSDSSRDFCKKSWLAVVTGNVKNTLSLVWADRVANYKVMCNIYNDVIHHWHATRFWFPPGTNSVTRHNFM